jgi:hypothetical protein
MQEKCARDAKRVVQALTRRNSEDCLAMETDIFEAVNGAGAYKAAVAEDLHEALRGLFRDEAELFRSGGDLNSDSSSHAHTRSVMCALFRGQRAEGRAVKNRSFGCVDGQRIKAYVNSHPEAFDVWMMLLLQLSDSFLMTMCGVVGVRTAVVSTRLRTELHEILLRAGPSFG